MKHYYRAHWEWFCEASGQCYWRAPGGNNVGVVDLRSNTQAGKQGGTPEGFAVFAYSEPQNIPGAVYLGTNKSVVAELIWTKLTTEADPTGKTAPRPLVGKIGKEVALYIAGEKVKSEGFTLAHRQRTIDVFQADYRENVGKYPKALLQKWVGAKMKEIYGEMSDEKAALLVPSEHRKGVLWRKPATTIGDTFTDTNGVDLEAHTASGANGGFSWTKLAGNSMEIQSNKLQRNTNTGHGDRDYRAESDLSTDDMYSKATVGSLGSDFDCAVSARFSASARTHYQTEWGNGFRRISKFVAGAHSVLTSDGSSNSVGDILEIRVDGSDIKSYRNGAQVLTTQTDTSITGHLRAGISIWHDQTTWDDWSAGDLAGGTAYDETFDETIVITASSVQATVRTISDTLVIVASSVSTFVRTIAENLTITDSKVATMIRTLTETISGTDTTTKTTTRTASDTLTISETMTAALVFLRTLTETLVITDTKIATMIRTIDETLSITDTVQRITARIVAETLVITDSITASITYIRTLAETLTISDSIGSRIIGRTLTEVISIIDDVVTSATQIYLKLRGAIRKVVLRGGVKKTNIRE